MDEDETHEEHFSCHECDGVEECDEECRCDVCTENLADHMKDVMEAKNDRD